MYRCVEVSHSHTKAVTFTPSVTFSVFLAGVVLIGSICSLHGRQQAWHAEVKLIELVEWLGMVSASEQTYQASRC